MLGRYEMTHADKTLGVYITMDDNEETKIKHLTALSEDFDHQLRTAKCEKNASMHTLQYSLMKTFEYPMAVTQLDEDTWTNILCLTLTAALYKAGMPMNFPIDVLFDPALFQGYQLQHPFFTQEISHITTLLQESVRNFQTGQLLRLTAEYLTRPTSHLHPMLLIVGTNPSGSLDPSTPSQSVGPS